MMGIFSGSTTPANPIGFGSFEGWDEFPEYGFPGTYQFNWENTPWTESPMSFQGPEINSLPNLDTMDPEARNTLINSGYDSLGAYLYNKPQTNNLDIARYRYDPYQGYMQYQDKAGNTGYMMGSGKYLDEKNALSPNLPNANLTTYRNLSAPTGQQDWYNLGYDPYGGKTNTAQYKVKENLGQGWFSQNMDWLVPSLIAGLGGGMALSGVGMNPGAAAGAVGADAGLGAMAGGQGATSVAPAGMLGDAAASIAPAAIGEAGMSLAPSAFGPAMDAALAPTLGAGASLIEGTAPIAAGLAGTAGTAGGSLGDIVTEAIKKMGSSAMNNFTRDPVGVIGKLVTSVLDNQRARSDEKANNAQQERYEQGADPFGPERDYYQGLLKQSYDNPYGLKDSPEYGGLGRIYQEQIARRDAAKGRIEAGVLPRDIEMQDHFMKWLGEYRSGLQDAAGSKISPNGVYASFLENQRANQAAQSNAYGSIPMAISKIFDPYANEKDSFTTAISDVLKRVFG